MIRRTFLAEEYINRYKKYGSDAKDDDGRLFSDLNSEEMTSLEVAHIIPHSFVSLNPGETELVCIIMFIVDFLLLISCV